MSEGSQQYLTATSRSTSRDLPDFPATDMSRNEGGGSSVDIDGITHGHRSMTGVNDGPDFGRSDQLMIAEGQKGGNEESAIKRNLLTVEEPAYGQGRRRSSTGSGYGVQELEAPAALRREVVELGPALMSPEPIGSPPDYSLSSPLRSRDTSTIEPPDLFNTNKKEQPSGRESARLPGRKSGDNAEEAKRQNSWENKENKRSYESQTLHRKAKSTSSSHSRSKRMRNRSLEMVLDDPTTDGSSATKRYR